MIEMKKYTHKPKTVLAWRANVKQLNFGKIPEEIKSKASKIEFFEERTWYVIGWDNNWEYVNDGDYIVIEDGVLRIENKDEFEKHYEEVK